MKVRRRKQRGQAIVEYVILIAVVAVTAFFVLTMFSDRLRQLISGATTALGGEKSETMDRTSEELTKSLTEDGDVN
ncbi:MAG: hypothetical protein IJC73_07630 [Lentisphaeria bacterium]|nr:hypothetical protein [Lentisphaeria bacterium]